MYTIYPKGVLERIKFALHLVENIELVSGLDKMKTQMKVGSWEEGGTEIFPDKTRKESVHIKCTNGAEFKITVEEVN